MKIETKFDIGQGVYYLHESIAEENRVYYIEKKICFGFIEYINISHYTVFYKINTIEIPEKHLFATKEEAEAKLKENKNESWVIVKV